MGTRVVVRLFLPIKASAVARIMVAVADACPGAKLADSGDPSVIDLLIEEPDRVARPLPVIEETEW